MKKIFIEKHEIASLQVPLYYARVKRQLFHNLSLIRWNDFTASSFYRETLKRKHMKIFVSSVSDKWDIIMNDQAIIKNASETLYLPVHISDKKTEVAQWSSVCSIGLMRRI